MNENINFKIDKRTAVHVKTRKLANEVNKLLDDLGATWCSGNKYTKIDNWDKYEMNTCYNVHEGCFGRIRFYTEEDYKIISAEEFLKLHKKSIFRRLIELVKRIFRLNT